MASDENPPFLAGKLVAMVAVIAGFLVIASGYRYESFMTALGGGLLLVVGLALLIAKIVRRNRDAA